MMKRFAMMALVAVMAQPAVAQDTKLTWQERCNVMAGLAGSIMGARQAGVPMSKSMETAEDDKLTQMIVLEAYDSPRYNGMELKQREISEFRDKWYMYCAKALRK